MIIMIIMIIMILIVAVVIILITNVIVIVLLLLLIIIIIMRGQHAFCYGTCVRTLNIPESRFRRSTQQNRTTICPLVTPY